MCGYRDVAGIRIRTEAPAGFIKEVMEIKKVLFGKKYFIPRGSTDLLMCVGFRGQLDNILYA